MRKEFTTLIALFGGAGVVWLISRLLIERKKAITAKVSKNNTKQIDQITPDPDHKNIQQSMETEKGEHSISNDSSVRSIELEASVKDQSKAPNEREIPKENIQKEIPQIIAPSEEKKEINVEISQQEEKVEEIAKVPEKEEQPESKQEGEVVDHVNEINEEKQEVEEAALTEAQRNILSRLETLTTRISRVEAAFGISSDESATIRRVRCACKEYSLNYTLKWVPMDYYSFPLETRRDILSAPSIHHLCKSILLENTSCTESDCSDPENSRFYIVIIQYTAKLHSHKIFTFVKSLKGLPRTKYHFRLAEEADSAALTGFEHNGMSPVGLTTKNIPIIIDEKITQLQPNYFWAGGGEIDVKIGFPVQNFCKNVPNCYVADVTH